MDHTDSNGTVLTTHLACAFPYGRILHYWAKRTYNLLSRQIYAYSIFVESLFANPTISYVLTSAGNIPVDRKTKDRQKLFAGTLEALSRGAAVALFPEGTSYTEPRIMQVKDGAAWAALEYTKWLREPGHVGEPVVIVPSAIVYTSKTKYRSRVSPALG